VQLLGLSELPDAQRERSRQIIERQVEQLVRLIDDLLDVSRISRDIITLRRTEVDIADIVARAVETNRPLLDARALALTVDIPDGSFVVYGEAARLMQALGNLLSNSAKFTEPGGAIRLSVARDGADVVVRVSDTGIGIPREMLSKVFDLFFQVDRGPASPREGLGLGLALVRRLVELHGGTVHALSDGPGCGTEIVLRLPLCKPTLTERVVRKALQPVVPPVAPRRILIADDNRDAAESLALLLRMEGHDVRIAYDGLEALDVGATFGAEVILLDLGMPNMNGWDAARKMREQPWARDSLLIAVTGWGQPQDRKRTADAGFDLHLVKPVDYAELAGALTRFPATNARPGAGRRRRQSQAAN
jgi:CheY-like chemotaxis protein